MAHIFFFGGQGSEVRNSNKNQKRGRSSEEQKNSERFFYCPEAAAAPTGQESNSRILTLPRDEGLHAIRVLRLPKGSRINLFDGRGQVFDGKICSIQRDEVEVEIGEGRACEVDPTVDLTLVVAQLKGKKVDFLIQKSVELGVSSIFFFPASRSVARPEPSKAGRQRWKKTVISACKQCGRSRLMALRSFESFDDVLQALPPDSDRHVFWEKQPAGAVKSGPSQNEGDTGLASGPIFLLIGPEGGWTEQEMEQIREAGFKSHWLGPRILRSETAALATATLFLHQLGELGPPIT